MPTMIPIEMLEAGILPAGQRSPNRGGRGKKVDFLPCPVEGCERNACSKAGGKLGLCCTHYHLYRNRKNGVKPKLDTQERVDFFKNVVLPHEGDECLFWPFRSGYTIFTVDGTQDYVHRLVCRFQNGEPPAGKPEAAHSCGNGHLGCVSRHHVRWASHAENMADKVAHGTSRRGVRNPSAKLNERAVREIRSLAQYLSNPQIAKKYGVSRGTVRSLLEGNSWGWVK